MVKIIEHSNLDSNYLNKIIEIKNHSWKHDYDVHLKWINENIYNGDLHFILEENKQIIAYANLVRVNLNINDYVQSIWGVGNVCTLEKRVGTGSQLMHELNNFLLKEDECGLLFCKEELINFYARNNWVVIKNLHTKPEIKTLIFNYYDDPSQIRGCNRLF